MRGPAPGTCMLGEGEGEGPGGGRGRAAPVPMSFLLPCLVPAERNSLCESRLIPGGRDGGDGGGGAGTDGHREAAACCLLVNKDVLTAGVPVLRHLCHSLPQRLRGSRAAPCLDNALSLEMEGWGSS